MSASDKKKLRKEQVAELLSEKQRQEQAEAKKRPFQDRQPLQACHIQSL